MNEELKQVLEENLKSKNPELNLSRMGVQGDEKELAILGNCNHLIRLIIVDDVLIGKPTTNFYHVPLKYTTSYLEVVFKHLKQIPVHLPQSLEELIICKGIIFQDVEFDLMLLKELTQLRKLNLKNNHLKNVEALGHLRQLEYLELQSNGIVDLSPLADLIKLGFLNLKDNFKITDISPLKDLVQLDTLILRNNQISQLPPLQNMRQLRYLDIRSNQVTNLAPINNLSKLSFLDLNNNQIVNLEPLANLTQLINLRLGSNQIVELTPLQNLNQITHLNLSFNKITELWPLQSLSELTHLRLYHNQIQDLNPLSILTKLLVLNISSNHVRNLASIKTLIELTTLDASSNVISDISPLELLTNLKVLSLSGNIIADLEPLRHLKQLTTLVLNGNHITDLSALKGLNQLKVLCLNHNQITDISSLREYPNLMRLDLSDNQLTDSNLPDLLKMKKLKHLNLANNQIRMLDWELVSKFPELGILKVHDNPITNIPAEIYNNPDPQNSGNSLSQLRDYFQALHQGATKVHQTKVILIGNGRVGKTCLVKRWLDNAFDPEEASTHAIQLRSEFLSELAESQSLDHVQLNVWDFGGQDIYHSTHQLFMQTEAVFVLVWDADTENQPTQTETLEDGTTVPYHNHRLPYWLNYVRYLGNSSPVIVVQSKQDLHGEQLAENWQALRQEYPNIVAGLSVGLALEDEDDNGISNFKHELYKVLRKQIKKLEYELPSSWWKVRLEMARLQDKPAKTLTLAAFSQICEAAGVTTDGEVTLRDYLHHTGALFYQEGLFEDQLIIDQKWAIDAVYTLFDRQGMFMKYRGQGFFKGEDLALCWGDRSLEEQELLISFMESCEICVEVSRFWEAPYQGGFIPFAQREYLAPQLLPDAPIPNQGSLFRPGISSVYVKLVHPFLHAAVMQQFIVQQAENASRDNLRRNCIYLTYEGQEVLVQAFPARHEIIIQLNPHQTVMSRPEEILQSVEMELRQLRPGLNEVSKWISTDGQGYVRWEALQNHSPYNSELQADNDQWYPAANFGLFLPIRHGLQYQHLTNHLENLSAPQQAIAHLEQANFPGYFEALKQVPMTLEQKTRFNSFKKEYESGRYNHEFEGRLRVFAQGFSID